MSGQPYRYASDVDKFRAEYMASLGLRTDLDDLNLQANKTYKETGALPPVSQMKDTRTTSEILADTEKLKQSILQDFKPLGSPQLIMGIIQGVLSSRLNSDGSFFTFLAQRAPELVRNLQKVYKFGIKGDANDIKTFVEFLEEMFSKQKNINESVKTYFNRPASLPGVGSMLGIISEGDLDSIKAIFEDVARKLMLKAQAIKPTVTDASYRGIKGDEPTYRESVINDIKNISSSLLFLKDFISSKQYKMFSEAYINEILKGTDLDNEIVKIFFDLYQQYIAIVERIPKADVLYALLKQLDNSLKNSSIQLSSKITNEIWGLFADIDQIEEIVKGMEEQIKLINSTYSANPTPSPFPGTGKRLGGDTYEPPKVKSQLEAQMESGLFGKQQYELIRRNIASDEINNKVASIDNEIVYLGDEVKEKRGRVMRLNEQINDEKIIPRLKTRYESIKDRLENEIEIISKNIRDLETEKASLIKQEHDITGHGIKRRRGRPKGCGIAKPYKETVKASTATTGIMESPRFVHFGKYLLNMHKLNNEGIFSLKQPSGGNIIGNPSIKISKNLSGVIKKMVGGGVPSFNELSQLSEPEKVYLHKVAKKSNIEDKFSIPTPSKDTEEKDMHQFEVMKGEIMSGNDNKEFIKKFKLLLMKLSKNGTLPKSEVNEILGDLVELGY
jgi:hypothetical protein